MTVTAVRLSGRSTTFVAGLAIWIVAMIVLPAPLAARVFLLAPLVIVPRLIPLLPSRAWIDILSGWPTFLAALPLPVAFALSPGPIAGVLALPWLAMAMVGAVAAIRHGSSQLPSILVPERLDDLGIDVALGFWGVGAVFALIDRLGVDTGFSAIIVLLTATHFHFAGFGLLSLASLLAVSRRWLRLAALGLIVGIPLTALGFVLSSDPVNAVGAAVVGTSGFGVGIALLARRGPGRIAWLSRVAGVALLIAMPMGIAWSLAILTGQSFVDLEAMVRTHGALNAMAVLLAVVAHRAEP